MTPEKQKKCNWLAIGWEFAFMNDRPCIIIAEHRLGKSNILLSSYENEGVIELKGYRKATDVAREIFAEIDNALHHMAVEYHNAGHPEYFAVCEMVYHKVLRRIEKKYTEVENNEQRKAD